MSRFAIGNVYLLLSVSLATGSQVLLKRLIDEFQRDADLCASLRAFATPAHLARGALATGMLVAGFLFWIACLVRLDLSYAYPIACSSVLLVALFSVLFLGEPVTLRVWLGTLLILGGLVLLTPRQ
jgi:drug/metabolite transporter (DMT)-like permease